MSRRKLLIYVPILIFAFLILPAFGECVDDNNNTTVDAITLQFVDAAADVICPDDPFDYYALEVADGVNVSGGSIELNSQESGTVIRVTRDGNILWEDSTTATETSRTWNIPSGTMAPGTYYLRISFYSRFAVDHPYTLNLNINTGRGGIAFNPEIANIMPELFNTLLEAPWPHPEGNASRTRSSAKYKGPRSGGQVKYSVNLAEQLGIEFDSSSMGRFRHLTVGSYNMIYFMYADDNLLFAYDLESGVQWQSEIDGVYYLDKSGRVYYIDSSQVLHCRSYMGDILWTKSFRGPGKITLENVGERIYIKSAVEHDESLFVYDSSGNRLFTYGPYWRITSVTETHENNLYLEIIDGDTKDDILYSLFPDGNLFWQMNVDDLVNSRKPMSDFVGHFWLPDPYVKAGFNDDKPGFDVVSKLGSLYGKYRVTVNSYIIDYCIPPNGILYTVEIQDAGFTLGAQGWEGFGLASRDITKSEDYAFDPDMLNANLSYKSEDIIAGADSVLYCALSKFAGGNCLCKIQIVDPINDKLLSVIQVDIPTSGCSGNVELAIGKGEILIYLNSQGYLKVFESTMLFPTLIKKGIGG